MNLQPFHLVVACANRTGQRVLADVEIRAESNGFHWSATVQGAGDPPAQLMGQADTLADIEAMVCQRVSRMAPVGEVIQISPTDAAPRLRPR